MSETQAKANAPHGTFANANPIDLPYRLRPKRCTACRVEKPRAEFPKKGDRSYADRCFDCRASGARAKAKKRRATWNFGAPA